MTLVVVEVVFCELHSTMILVVEQRAIWLAVLVGLG
jgi:hypothetical protein